MKRKKQMVFLAAGVLLAAAAAVAVWIGNSRSRMEKSEILKIGVLIYKEDDTFVSGIVEEMKRQFKDDEREKGSRIRLDFAYAEENQSIQNEQIDKYLSLDYDVLCVNLVDRTEAAIVIEKAKAADVPVVFFNREPVAEDLQQWDRLYYVGSDAKESGTLEGLLVVDFYKKYPEKLDKNQDGVIQYVLLEGESRHQDSLIRTEYSVQTLVDAGISLERLDGGIANWVRSQAEALTTQWLKEYGNEIELIISNNDDMALGAIDALSETDQELEDWPLIVGVDATAPALEAVAAGQLYGTVLNDAKGQAQAMVDLALALYTGEDPAQAVALEDGHYIWLPYRQVTREDLTQLPAQ